MKINNKRGQSTVEYVLLVTAVVAVMIAFSTNSNKGGLQDQLCSSLNSVASDMNSMADRLHQVHISLPTNPGGNDENTYFVNVIPK